MSNLDTHISHVDTISRRDLAWYWVVAGPVAQMIGFLLFNSATSDGYRSGVAPAAVSGLWLISTGGLLLLAGLIGLLVTDPD